MKNTYSKVAHYLKLASQRVELVDNLYLVEENIDFDLFSFLEPYKGGLITEKEILSFGYTVEEIPELLLYSREGTVYNRVSETDSFEGEDGHSTTLSPEWYRPIS